MFWKFGGYGSASPVDAILDRPDFTLEELLDESELLGDIKALNNKLLEYLRQRDVIGNLLDFVVAPKPQPPTTDSAAIAASAAAAAASDSEPTPNNDAAGEVTPVAADAGIRLGKPRLLRFGRSRSSSSATDGDVDEEEEAEKRRNKYALVACEVLSSDNWTISDSLLNPENRDLLHKFWQFLKQPAPLDPLQASYFTKVNESLFDRKVDDMVQFLKSTDGAVYDMLRHVDSPMVMDLLLKTITMDRPESGQNIVEWLYTQDLIPTLLSFLNPENSWVTQTSAGDFIKAIITVSANATQHEQTCIGPNELTRQLVSHPCIDELISYMLKGGNALTVGVGIVIEVIRKNNSDYDPDVGTETNSQPSSRDPIYLGTLLRMFAQNVPNFMQLMNNAPAQQSRLNSTFGDKIEPLGFDRFKTCELMAELLHCSNMGLLNEPGSEGLIATRDAERHRLRREGKLTPMRGEESSTLSNTDLLTMRVAPPEESRRLEVTNSSAADDDGFEEVTHATGLGEEGGKASQQLAPQQPILPSNGPTLLSQSFIDKDEDDFVEEPLSSPRLKTHDDQIMDDTQFEDPGLLVAPLSPNRTRNQWAYAPSLSDGKSVDVLRTENDDAEGATKDELAEGSDDFVTEATEPALGDEAKRMVPDLEKGDESDPSIMFTPTISSLSESLEAQSLRQVSTAPPETLALDNTTAPDTTVGDGQEATEEDSMALTPVPDVQQKPPIESDQDKLVESATGTPTDEKAFTKADVAKNETETEASEGDVGNESIIVAPPLTAADAPNEHIPNEPRSSDPVVGDFLKMQFVDYRVVPTILSFFFSYPWNNFLHNVVYDVVQQVFNGPMDRGFNPELAISLFESGDITTQIINGQLVSEQSQAATRMRMGYMGHLTLIAEEVVKFTERHPPELLSDIVLDKVMSQDWISYVEGPLAETRERDNAILGGVRPEVAVGNPAAAAGLAAVGLSGLGSSLGLTGPQGTSSALADAGLNGSLDFHSSMGMQNNEGLMSPFSISAGISSGFHSSSDEEDDDVDDNDEDINNEVSQLLIEAGRFVEFGAGNLCQRLAPVQEVETKTAMQGSSNNGSNHGGPGKYDSLLCGADEYENIHRDVSAASVYGPQLTLCESFAQASALVGSVKAGGVQENGAGQRTVNVASEGDMISKPVDGTRVSSGGNAEDKGTSGFRAYTDPLNASSSLLPPAIPPPPPPPPPLNIPPSRARRQLAARLAMNKRNAEVTTAAQAECISNAEDGGGNDDGDIGSRDVSWRIGCGSGTDSVKEVPRKTLAELLQQPSLNAERIRNPFADDEDDDSDDDDGDDEDEDEDDNVGLNGRRSSGRGEGGGDVGRVGLGWNRGSWWRSMVQRDGRKALNDNNDDGPEENDAGVGDSGSSSDDDNAGRRPNDYDDNDDEEFGDFAMPEVVSAPDGGLRADDRAPTPVTAVPTTIATTAEDDPSGHYGILVRPLALHLSSNNIRNDASTGSNSNSGTMGSVLWSFDRLGFLGSSNNTKDEATLDVATDVPTTVDHNAYAVPACEPDMVLGDDGRKMARVREAKQRTSLEDHDEDEIVV